MRIGIGGHLLLFCQYQNKMSSTTTQNETTTIFDNCVNDLELNGYALLSIPTIYQNNDCERKRSSIANAFATARCSLDDISSNNKIPIIDPSSDSGSWTGYHNAAVVNGRYNQYREGFVFSNGEMFNVDTTNINNNFENDMNNLFQIMLDDVANGVLRAIERRLELPDQYFDTEFGPTNTSSQWHLKRYVLDDDDSDEQNHNLVDGDGDGKEQGEVVDVVLPVHTDPSLISVVIVDQVGSNESGMGLQVYHPSEKNEGGSYEEISHSGHDVAIIFIGSVLNYLTKGQIFSAAKHRVVNWTSTNVSPKDDKDRMAATLFVRPNGDSIMNPLPSAYLQYNESKKKPPTFSVWNSRVAKNYMKKKQQQKG